MKLRIKEAARERGLTLAYMAGRLGIHRSNMSAIASGARGVSLQTLRKIGLILDAGLDEFIMPEERRGLFKTRSLEAALDTIEMRNYDGIDKSWVDRVMLAHRAHYRKARRAP